MQRISSLRLGLQVSLRIHLRAVFLLLGMISLFSSCSSSSRSYTAPLITARKPRVNHLGYSRPISTKYRISQWYKPRKNRKHKGIDIAGKKGSPIFTVASGRVVYQGRKFSGYGKMILIKHDKGISTIYAHLSKIFVTAGQRVSRGQLIGAMGNTGRSSGVHLHFEIMKNKLPVNPTKYIKF